MTETAKQPGNDRSRFPVFVMGCHRSGTNLLYDTLLSAGGFAIYRGLIPIYKILMPRFGSLQNPENRRKIAEVWLRSKGFRRSGLDGEEFKKRAETCRTGGDFIRITLDELARNQNAQRWAMYDADSVLHVPRIKRDIPEALFVHIIRDGRDIALSLRAMGGFRPWPWSDGSPTLRGTAAYWQWMVRRGRKNGQRIPNDYIEIHYEELITEPRKTLAKLGEFLHHDLNYERIQQNSLGRLSDSNSSFRGVKGEEQVSPLQRWKQRLSPEDVAGIEKLVGDCLEEFGYELHTDPGNRRPGLSDKAMVNAYNAFLSTKFWLKIETPVGRFANLEALELAEPVPNTKTVP